MINTSQPSLVVHDDGIEPAPSASGLYCNTPHRSQTVETTPTSLCITASESSDSTMKADVVHSTAEWGADTVRLAFLVDLAQSSPDFWEKTMVLTKGDGSEAEHRFGTLKSPPHADVYVSLYTYGAAHCHLEFNAPRQVHGKSETLWTPDGLVDLVRGLLERVKQHVWPEFIRYTADGEILWDDDWTDQVRIRRLDVALNFTVSDPALVRNVLPSVKPLHARRTPILHEYQNGGWGLVNPTKTSGQDRIYNKAAELRAKGIEPTPVPSGAVLFRFETQLQGDRLRKYGMTRLSGVTSEAAWKALEGRWATTRWGDPLCSPFGLLDALAGLSPLVLARHIGFLTLDAWGVAEQELGRSRVKAERSLARQRGLTPGLPVDSLGKAEVFLSLATGALEPVLPV